VRLVTKAVETGHYTSGPYQEKNRTNELFQSQPLPAFPAALPPAPHRVFVAALRLPLLISPPDRYPQTHIAAIQSTLVLYEAKDCAGGGFSLRVLSLWAVLSRPHAPSQHDAARRAASVQRHLARKVWLYLALQLNLHFAVFIFN
jgi:hypothetical protein